MALDAPGAAEDRERLVLVEEQAYRGAEQDQEFKHDADAVQDRDHPDARRDQDGRGQRGEDGDDHLVAEGDRQVGEQARQHHVHDRPDCGHDQDDRDHVEQAGDPAEEVAAELAGPLVDTAGQRVVRAQLGPGQRQQQLQREDDRDRPDEGRTADRQGSPGDQQRAGRGSLERHGEKRSGEEAECALEPRLYTKLPQVLVVTEFPGLCGTYGWVVSH